jgi:hypothetical protein
LTSLDNLNFHLYEVIIKLPHHKYFNEHQHGTILLVCSDTKNLKVLYISMLAAIEMFAQTNKC